MLLGGTPANQSSVDPSASNQASQAMRSLNRLTVARGAGRVNRGNALWRLDGSTTSNSSNRARPAASSRPATSR
jgi:hypothetical protein